MNEDQTMELEDLRLAVYRTFAATGHAPTMAMLAEQLGTNRAEVPAAHMWDDVVHTCGNQRIFCSPTCVDQWLERTGQTRGYIMDLAALWRLAEHWYEGRLDYGYIRREPAAAADYFRSVGFTGSFWGGSV